MVRLHDLFAHRPLPVFIALAPVALDACVQQTSNGLNHGIRHYQVQLTASHAPGTMTPAVCSVQMTWPWVGSPS